MMNMRKTTFLLLIFMIACVEHNSRAQVSLEEFSLQQQKIQDRGMYALGGWATGNILVNGGILLSGTPEGSSTHFYRMNMYWNVVNLGLAGITLLQRGKPGQNSLSDLVKKQKRMENLFLLNAGVDVGYMVGGLYLQELANREDMNGNQLKGFGQAVLLQGGFLFVFDVIMYLVSHQHARILDPILDRIEWQANGIGFRYRF